LKAPFINDNIIDDNIRTHRDVGLPQHRLSQPVDEKVVVEGPATRGDIDATNRGLIGGHFGGAVVDGTLRQHIILAAIAIAVSLVPLDFSCILGENAKILLGGSRVRSGVSKN
jgi:hypothetical protein